MLIQLQFVSLRIFQIHAFVYWERRMQHTRTPYNKAWNYPNNIDPKHTRDPAEAFSAKKFEFQQLIPSLLKLGLFCSFCLVNQSLVYLSP